MKLNYLLTPYTGINSKWVKDLSISLKTIKILLENIGSRTSDTYPLARKTKEKINELGYIKLKRFFYSKGNHQQNEKVTHLTGEHICQ